MKMVWQNLLMAILITATISVLVAAQEALQTSSFPRGVKCDGMTDDAVLRKYSRRGVKAAERLRVDEPGKDGCLREPSFLGFGSFA
jgi:hypothetical protein